VRPVVERDLGARDRPDAERLARLRVLHRAVQPVVVGECERGMALPRGGAGDLDRVRRPVEEREARMEMQLDVGHRRIYPLCENQRPRSRSRKTTTQLPSARTSSK
jgi:hypothetical protein